MTIGPPAIPALLRSAALLALLVATRAGAQGDPAPYRQKAEAASKRAAELQAKANEQIAATRKSIDDKDNKVQGDLDDVANKVLGQDFAAALGTIPIAESHVEYVPEAARPAFLAALAQLKKGLETGAQARAQQDALQLLGDRIEGLATQVKDGGDLVAPLRDLDDTVNQIKAAQALDARDLAALRIFLAGHKNKARQRQMEELRERTTAELATLEAEYPAIQKALGERSEREQAIARFEQGANSVLDAIARLPADDKATKDLRARVEKMDAPVRDAYSKLQAVATGERLKGTLDFQAYQFEGWEQETGGSTAEDYLKVDCTLELLGCKRTANLIGQANSWLAAVAKDAEFQRITPDPKLQALLDKMRKDRDTALLRVVAVAEALVADIEKTGISEPAQRDRAAYLADWDLRMTLHEHPRQWDLIARVYKLTDAFDQKTLGNDAISKRREEAAKTVDSQWSRMVAALPIAGGFVGDQAGKFRDKFIQIQAGRNYADEFVAGEHDLVFRVDGELLAARLDPAVKAALAAARTRLALTPAPEDEYEIVALVGAEGTLGLPAPDGKGAGATLPCRTLKVVGVRLGPIGFLAR